MNRYIIGALALIGLAVLLIILLFTGNNKVPPAKTINLASYANTNAVVKLVDDGPIVAPQNHNTADIVVSQYSATFDLIQGYDGNVVTSKEYNNSQNSFRSFLYALYYAGFTRGSSNINYPAGDAGLCSSGDRYDLYLINNGKTILHYWDTNCGATARTYDGNLYQTLSLFEAQIPDISKLSAGANF